MPKASRESLQELVAARAVPAATGAPGPSNQPTNQPTNQTPGSPKRSHMAIVYGLVPSLCRSGGLGGEAPLGKQGGFRGWLVGFTGQAPRWLREQPVQQQVPAGARSKLLARRIIPSFGIPGLPWQVRTRWDSYDPPGRTCRSIPKEPIRTPSTVFSQSFGGG